MLRPLGGDWRDCGIEDALCKCFYGVFRKHGIDGVPARRVEWLVRGELGGAHMAALRLGAAQRRCVREALGRRRDPAMTVALSEQEANAHSESTWSVADTIGLRVVVGELIEVAVVKMIEHYEEEFGQPGVGDQPASQRRLFSQKYFEGYAAAVWTSAHAQAYADVRAEAAAGAPEHIPSVTLTSVPCASGMADATDLFARRHASANDQAFPPETRAFVQLLARCTHPGVRGWDRILNSVVGLLTTRTLVFEHLAVCLSGLHPQLHPGARLPWPARMDVLDVVARVNQSQRVEFGNGAHLLKEVFRRAIASLVAASTATRAALVPLAHPIRHLHEPPFALPHKGMHAAMVAFVEAGAKLVAPKTAGVEESDFAHLEKSLECAFDEASRPVAPTHRSARYPYWSDWLGRGTTEIKSRQRLVDVASMVWSSAFRANFVPLWLFGQVNKSRIVRLDASQYASVHSLNQATALAKHQPRANALHAQRCALQHPSAARLTVHEVVQELCGGEGMAGGAWVELGGSSPNSSRLVREPREAIALLSTNGVQDAARLLTYARAAWIKEETLTVQFGECTRDAQLRAVVLRAGRADLLAAIATDASGVMRTLPIQATHLCFCGECRRVANAVSTVSSSDDDGRLVPFTEVGVACCQVDQESGTRRTSLYCAKRPSAAVKGAWAYDAKMQARDVELSDRDDATFATLESAWANGKRSKGGDTGIAQRMRRDAKTSFDQHAKTTACGDAPLLSLSLIGKAIRVYKGWYTICTRCGVVMKLRPDYAYTGCQLSCMRCVQREEGRTDVDAATSAVSGAAAAKESICDEGFVDMCRCCGVQPPKGATGWQRVHAPLDTSPPNIVLPPSLRSVLYCPLHFRRWVTSAHMALETTDIIAHIMLNARPVFNSNDSDADDDAENPMDGVKSRGGGSAVPQARSKRVAKRMRKVAVCAPNT